MESLVIKSEGGLFPHTHTLEIPKAQIMTPPNDGITLKTSAEYSLFFKHTHEVKLSKEDLTAIAAGQTIVARDTDKGRHSFQIKLT